MELEVCTEKLASVLVQIKKLEKEKEALRAEFFALADRALAVEHHPLERQIVKIDASSKKRPEDILGDEYPESCIVQRLPDEGHMAVFEIEPDVSKMKYVFVNRRIGQVFQRQSAFVGSYFDMDAFRAETCRHHPDWYSVVDKTVQVVETLNEERVQNLVAEVPEALETLQRHAHQGRLQMKLAAPRKMKDDE